MGKRSRQDIAPAAAPRVPGPIDIQIGFAIANTRLVQVVYHGSLRVAEPHDYGRLNDTTKLLIYQVSRRGDASSKDATGWRLLEVDQITQFSVLEQTFPGSRGETYARHLPWQIIYARVADTRTSTAGGHGR
jgi:hypothetical protein